jgi:purine-cytosine permease-like protein
MSWHAAASADWAIERNSIDYVPESERHGRVIEQLPFWFLGNFHFFTIAIGFVGPSMGLGFGYTPLAAALGILLDRIRGVSCAGFGVLLSLASVAALTATMGLNAYSGMPTVLTALNSLFGSRPTPRLRVTTIIVLAVLWAGLALAISANAVALLFAVLTIMLYLLVPWSAINLIDYFFLRRGRYAIAQFFVPHGIYGGGACAG